MLQAANKLQRGDEAAVMVLRDATDRSCDWVNGRPKKLNFVSKEVQSMQTECCPCAMGSNELSRMGFGTADVKIFTVG